MLCVILASLVVTTLLSAVFIRTTESHKSDRLLQMLCASGQRSLDYYFDSVQNSVTKVTTFAEEDLDSVNSEEELAAHIERIREYFCMTASKTKGVLTYYYRIDPSVSSERKGVWYIDLNGQGFEEHEVTDITQYDVEDTSKLVWFTVPKHEGKPIWLPPYITDNLDVRVISYNAPVYWKGQFIGVIGIEIDYETLAREVENIRIFETGYAFILDEESRVIYHPQTDSEQLDLETTAINDADRFIGSNHIQYTFEGEEKEAVWIEVQYTLEETITV